MVADRAIDVTSLAAGNFGGGASGIADHYTPLFFNEVERVENVLVVARFDRALEHLE